MSKPLTLLIDADMLVFEATSSVEREINWYDDLWTLHADAGEAKAKIDDMVQSLVQRVLAKTNHEGAYEILMCFTDDNNFRKKIYPLYKSNRAGKRKPVCYYAVKTWVKENFDCYQKPNLEADDCIGILATMKANTVIVSGDKDFKSVPGKFFDYLKGVLHEITVEEADRWHLYQTLIGDTTDGYPGCPGVGAVTAEKLLAEGCSWDMVVKQYAKKGLTEEDALVQARVARILRKEDYDFNKKEPILWKP